MLWNPAYLALTGTKPDLTTVLPALPNPVYGLDTSVNGLMFSDTAGTTEAVAGASVARINDVFGGLTHILQSTATARPVLTANAVGSRPGLRFNGTAHWMPFAGTNPGTLFQSRTFTVLLCYRRATATDYAGFFAAGHGMGGSGNTGYDMLQIEGNAFPNGWPKLLRAGGADVNSALLTGASYANGQVHKVVARGAVTLGMELRSKSLSGSFTGTGQLPSSADSFTWNTALIGAGLGYAGVSPPRHLLNGDIYEFRFWNSYAGSDTFTQLQNYLDAKYGA